MATEERNDSALLERSLVSASRSFTSNGAMGFGTGRDPMGLSYIQQVGDLGDLSATLLYESSHLVQKIVYTYPLEAADHWLKFTAKSDSKGSEIDTDLQDYLNSKAEYDLELSPELSQGRLSDLFFEASFNARLYGRGYILLGVEDGQEWFEPINVSSIKSLRRMETLFRWEVTPHRAGRQRYNQPTHYRLNRSWNYAREKEDAPTNGLIHHSRILRFDGLLLPELGLQRRSGQGKSVIDTVWKALSRSENSFNAAAYLLQTASMFTYGLKGLSEIRDETMRAAIESRFQSIMFSMSVLKGIPHDPDQEVVSTISKEFGSVDKVLQMILDQVAVECDIPRAKLFEMSQAGGLNSIGTGENERFLWSQALDGWRKRHWSNPFLYLGKIALLAKDCKVGKSVKGLGVKVPDSLQLSPSEKLDMREKHIRTMDIATRIQALNPWEVRESSYGGNEWSFEVTLDDRVSAMMEKQATQPEPEVPIDGELVGGDPQQALPPGQAPRQPGVTPPALAGGDWEQMDRADDGTRPQRRMKWQGFTIGLQYRTGDLRHGRAMMCPYGYFEKTRGADGMAVDVYVGPFLNSDRVFVIDQVINGQFDEHKYVIGVKTIEDARDIYENAMPPEFLGDIKESSLAAIEAQRIR